MYKKMWQTEWERCPENKLFEIQSKVDDPIPSGGRRHREEIALCLLLSVTQYTIHFYSLKVMNRLCVFFVMNS